MLSKIIKSTSTLSERENVELIVDSNRVLVVKNKIVESEIKLKRSMRSIDVKAVLRAFKMEDGLVICFPAKSIASLREINVKIGNDQAGKISGELSNEAVLLTRRSIYIDKVNLEKFDAKEREDHDFNYCIADTRDSLVLAYMFFKGYSRAVHSKYTNKLTELEQKKMALIPTPGLKVNAIDFSDLGIATTCVDLKENERYYQIYDETKYQSSMLRLEDNTFSIIDDTVHGVINNIVKSVKKEPWILHINKDSNQPIISYDMANVVRISMKSFDTSDIKGELESKERQLREIFETALRDSKYMKWDYILIDDITINPDLLSEAPVILCKPNLNLKQIQSNVAYDIFMECREPGIVYSNRTWGYMRKDLSKVKLGSMEVNVGKAKMSVIDVIDTLLQRCEEVKITHNKIEVTSERYKDSTEEVLNKVMEERGVIGGKVEFPSMWPVMNKYFRAENNIDVIELGKFRVLVNHLDALSGVLTMRIVIKGIRTNKQGNPTNIVDRIIEAIETNGSVAVEESNEISIKTNSDNIVVI